MTAILASVKAREEGRTSKPGPAMGGMGAGPASTPRQPGLPPQRQTLPNYNRYDQEQFRAKDDTHGFNIETMGTFSGMTLKSVTEGSHANRNKQGQMGGGRPGAMGPPGAPGAAGSGGPTGTTPKSGASPGNPSGASGKRPSRTPIIIIPAAPKSLVTMYNAKDILQVSISDALL